MPKVLDSYDFPHGGRKGVEFNWDSVLDGKIYQLEQGKDFPDNVSPKTFVGAVARQASAKNLRVKRQIDGKILVLQAVAKAETTPANPTAS